MQTRFSPLSASAAMLTALLLTFAPLGATPQTKPSAPGTSTAKAVRPNAARPAARPRIPAQGTQEGIKVHGHWTIEVRNPDGSLVSRRDFENSLDPGGNFVLTNLLGRGLSAGLWAVVLDNTSGGTRPCSDTRCYIVESPETLVEPGLFKTLTVSVPTSGPNSGKLVLSGNATATAATSINDVKTVMAACNWTNPPSTPCTLGQTTLPSVVTTATVSQLVLAGQIIQVTVVISFS